MNDIDRKQIVEAYKGYGLMEKVLKLTTSMILPMISLWNVTLF